MIAQDEEMRRFLKLVDKAYRDDAIAILSENMPVSLVRTNIKTEGSGDGYYDNYTTITHGDWARDFTLIMFNPKFAQLKEEDAAFIISFISRRFERLKLIFSSSLTHVFARDSSAMDAIVSNMLGKGFTVDLFSHNKRITTLYLLENNADVSDDMWKIILKEHRNTTCMLLAYASGKYAFSDKIKKRIHDLYESLSDSDKLLLELGMAPENKEDGSV